MNEVLPDMFSLSIPMPTKPGDYVNSYLVRGNKKCLLIDTGWRTPEAFDSLKKQLAEIGVRLDNISRIVATHIHPDHYGLVGKLKQFSNATIYLHYREVEFINSRYINMDALIQHVETLLSVNGVPPGEMPEMGKAFAGIEPVLPDVILRGGEQINFNRFHFQVLWTPGHSAGHICLYEPEQRVLLTGDHVLPAIATNVGLNPQSDFNPLKEYLDSLDTLSQLDVSLVLPGHGYPFTNLKQRIEQLNQHYKQRNSEILATLKDTPKTVYQIARQIAWYSSTGSGLDGLGAWERRMAILETFSHMEAMRADGMVDKMAVGKIILYERR
ncbi:hypothetical protein DSCO28_26390 [Desulfosarcina ovata subsp. sediminis]|uniref:Metallo-beta-lactamase domain-containing protein n=1 Tax=Desulfosarcina ovata subsp. sediminis TaxID=885957 RepID=A0A5K7ZRL8_9BACT|nr:MBL fold metallo-hydrolase [Desulfosarcina ovata]BBO82073.1 hypothetical protein DSCO28_26390 [Desulfosarcina ovata subsp. sediminis]